MSPSNDARTSRRVQVKIRPAGSWIISRQGYRFEHTQRCPAELSSHQLPGVRITARIRGPTAPACASGPRQRGPQRLERIFSADAIECGGSWQAPPVARPCSRPSAGRRAGGGTPQCRGRRGPGKPRLRGNSRSVAPWLLIRRPVAIRPEGSNCPVFVPVVRQYPTAPRSWPAGGSQTRCQSARRRRWRCNHARSRVVNPG